MNRPLLRRSLVCRGRFQTWPAYATAQMTLPAAGQRDVEGIRVKAFEVARDQRVGAAGDRTRPGLSRKAAEAERVGELGGRAWFIGRMYALP